jgi:hypothetical protein
MMRMRSFMEAHRLVEGTRTLAAPGYQQREQPFPLGLNLEKSFADRNTSDFRAAFREIIGRLREIDEGTSDEFAHSAVHETRHSIWLH